MLVVGVAFRLEEGHREARGERTETITDQWPMTIQFLDDPFPTRGCQEFTFTAIDERLPLNERRSSSADDPQSVENLVASQLDLLLCTSEQRCQSDRILSLPKTSAP